MSNFNDASDNFINSNNNLLETLNQNNLELEFKNLKIKIDEYIERSDEIKVLLIKQETFQSTLTSYMNELFARFDVLAYNNQIATLQSTMAANNLSTLIKNSNINNLEESLTNKSSVNNNSNNISSEVKMSNTKMPTKKMPSINILFTTFWEVMKNNEEEKEEYVFMKNYEKENGFIFLEKFKTIEGEEEAKKSRNTKSKTAMSQSKREGNSMWSAIRDHKPELKKEFEKVKTDYSEYVHNLTLE